MSESKTRLGANIRFTFFALVLICGLAWSSSSVAASKCNSLGGSLVEVVANMDWNNAFPITLFGMPVVPGNGNPPRLHMDAFCKCNWRTPGLNAIPFGIGMTFWNPMYIIETANKSGCFSTLPISGLLSGYSGQDSAKTPDTSSGFSHHQRRQVHFFIAPLFKLLDLFGNVFCSGETKPFDLAYVTEIDPAWQNDVWTSTLFPGGSVLANVVARTACIVDGAKINIARSYPIDALWWCLGQSSLYPPSGNSSTTSSAEQTNMKAIGRFLFRQHRMSALSTTIGRGAQCFAHYSPRLPKQQYRVDPVFPAAVNDVSKPIVLGRNALMWKFPPPVVNYPSHEAGAFVLWRGTQCCLRF